MTGFFLFFFLGITPSFALGVANAPDCNDVELMKDYFSNVQGEPRVILIGVSDAYSVFRQEIQNCSSDINFQEISPNFQGQTTEEYLAYIDEVNNQRIIQQQQVTEMMYIENPYESILDDIRKDLNSRGLSEEEIEAYTTFLKSRAESNRQKILDDLTREYVDSLNPADLEELKNRMNDFGVSEADQQARLTEVTQVTDYRVNQIRNNCTSLSHLNELPPTRDQGPQGWCYAFATADILSQKMGENISPGALAMGQQAIQFGILRQGDSISSTKSLDSGGFISDTLDYVIESDGACLEKNYPYWVGERSNPEILNEINEFRRIAQPTNDEACDLYKDVGSHFPLVDQEQFIQLAKDVAIVDLTYALKITSCAPGTIKRINFNKNDIISRKYDTDEKRREVSSNLDQSLEEGRVVAISMYTENFLNSSTANTGDRGAHAMVVVGREFNEQTRSCEYLVRNSWGNSCNNVSSSISCNPINGVLSIPANILNENVYLTDEIK